jgi:polyhydroxyalkanoate synthesis regulator phasin
MLDAVKNYLNLASGVTEVTRQRAIAAAKALAETGEATAEQVSNIADELLVSSRNNRDAMLALVRYEVDRALNRVGLATADEVASLQRRVTSLEGAITQAESQGDERADAPVKQAAKKAAPAKKASAAKKAPAKAPARETTATATAAKSTAAKSTAAKATATKSAATKSAAEASPAKATAAKATASKSTAPSKAPAKKAASSGSSGSSGSSTGTS